MNKKIYKELCGTRNRLARCRWTMLGDLQDMDKAIKLVKNGRDVQAARLLDDFDTDLRDQLRYSTYKWAMKTLGREDEI